MWGETTARSQMSPPLTWAPN